MQETGKSSAQTNSGTKADLYKRYIERLATSSDDAYHWPGLKILYDFIQLEQVHQQRHVEFTVLDIYRDEKQIGDHLSRYHFATFNSPQDLDDCLEESSWHSGPYSSLENREKHTHNPVRSRLFVIENLCPQTVFKLGGALDIDPQFWADYLETLPWYRIAEVSPRLVPLPSSQREERFLKMTAILPRELACETSTESTSESIYPALFDDKRSYIEPDKATTRVRRKAGLIKPLQRDGKVWDPIAFIRQSVGIWAKQRGQDDDEWIAIMLVDPPFQPQIQPRDKRVSRQSQCQQTNTDKFTDHTIKGAEFREFRRRPSMSTYLKKTGSQGPLSSASSVSIPLSPLPYSRVQGHHSQQSGNANSFFPPKRPSASIRTAFISLLSYRLSVSPSFRQSAPANVFLLFSDLYFLLASEWLVADEYVNRELATIEYRLEKGDPSFRHLQKLLKVLFVQRRRCTRYAEMIVEVRTQCQQRGQPSWPRAIDNKDAKIMAEALVGDFNYVHMRVGRTLARVEKNISLLTALVSIGEAEHSLLKNEGVARLTLVAALYLPFSTVAAVLSIPGNIGPGHSQFWKYWALSVPLMVVVVALLWFYKWAKLGKIKTLLRRRKSMPGGIVHAKRRSKQAFGGWHDTSLA